MGKYGGNFLRGGMSAIRGEVDGSMLMDTLLVEVVMI